MQVVTARTCYYWDHHGLVLHGQLSEFVLGFQAVVSKEGYLLRYLLQKVSGWL